MTTPWEEKQILRDVIDGLNLAIEEQSWDPELIDDIKFNKLLYLATDCFDLPVTFWWYKYGSDFTRHGNVRLASLEPKAQSEIASPEQPRVSSETDGELPSPNDYKEFFVEEVDEIDRLFDDDTKEYLRGFYEDYAPDNLVDLYTASSILQKSLDRIGRSEYPEREVQQTLDTVLGEIRDLEREVLKSQVVADTDVRFKEYSSLLKDVLVSVGEGERELTERKREGVKDVIRFFYENAWLLVSLKIASERAEGDNALKWRERAAARFNFNLSNYGKELNSLKVECYRRSFLADELVDFAEPIAKRADLTERKEIESRGFEEWKGASKEANRHL